MRTMRPQIEQYTEVSEYGRRKLTPNWRFLDGTFTLVYEETNFKSEIQNLACDYLMPSAPLIVVCCSHMVDRATCIAAMLEHIYGNFI